MQKAQRTQPLIGLGCLKPQSTTYTSKMAIYCPQGSGTLCDQLLTMHGIAWYCMGLYAIVWYCMVLHGIAWYCMVLHGIA